MEKTMQDRQVLRGFFLFGGTKLAFLVVQVTHYFFLRKVNPIALRGGSYFAISPLVIKCHFADFQQIAGFCDCEQVWYLVSFSCLVHNEKLPNHLLDLGNAID